MNTLVNRRLSFAALVLVAAALSLSACDNVGVEPKGQASAENIFQEEGAYKSYLAKLYGGLNVTGQSGPAGNPDIAGIDEGFSQYIRLWWQMQELPTDEAVIAWSDGAVQELNTMTWGPSNGFSSAMYSRVFFQVAQANEFLRQSTEDRLAARNVPQQVQEQIPQWRAEARFLRALSYWHGLDLFGNIPLVTQEFPRGGQAPEQSTRQEVFEFVESELKAITDGEGAEELPDPRQAQYGRADKAAAYMVLANLYLNAEVYVGQDRYSDVVEYTQRVMDAGYSLEDNYRHLFLADNHTAHGIVFAIPNDGLNTQHFGGTTFLVHAAIGGAMNPAEYGTDFGWAGLRTTPQGVSLYDDEEGERALFFTEGQSLEIEELTDFTDGYATPKYQDVTSDGGTGSTTTYPDTDYPMFRLGEAYLMYAEAVLRGGGGSRDRALDLVNELRERAGVDEIESSDLTLDFLLAERGRELYWEARRRMDLIRYGLFTSGDYLWAWKGNVQQGQDVPDHLDVYPLPASELLANPNLEQNEGYGGGEN